MSQHKKIVQSYYQNLWNNQDKSYIDKLLHDDILFKGSLGVETKGKKEFESYFDMITTAVPNLYHAVELLVEEGDYVVARAWYSGTQRGKLLGFEATNNKIRYNGASFFTIVDNKIKTIWVLGDLYDLSKQLQR
ncbi:MAG: ester cyclase [Campylobacterales bacterium]|nr:ester cyclase [Campylobacterales bacterium]